MDQHFKIISQINEIDRIIASKDEERDDETAKYRLLYQILLSSNQVADSPYSVRVRTREREKIRLEEILQKVEKFILFTFEIEEENQSLRIEVQQLQNNKRKSDQALADITAPLLKVSILTVTHD